MTREYSRIFLKVILVLGNLSEVNIWISTLVTPCYLAAFPTRPSRVPV